MKAKVSAKKKRKTFNSFGDSTLGRASANTRNQGCLSIPSGILRLEKISLYTYKLTPFNSFGDSTEGSGKSMLGLKILLSIPSGILR